MKIKCNVCKNDEVTISIWRYVFYYIPQKIKWNQKRIMKLCCFDCYKKLKGRELQLEIYDKRLELRNLDCNIEDLSLSDMFMNRYRYG